MSRTAIHPGEVLGDELQELGISHERFAQALGISGSSISRIIAGKQAVSAEMSLRLGHWFGQDPRFWLNLQMQHDLRRADGKIGNLVAGLPTRGDATSTHRAEPG